MNGNEALTRLGDDLRQMQRELKPRAIHRAVKNAWAKVARDVRRQATTALKSSPIHNAAEIAKAIRAKAFRNHNGAIVAADFRTRPERGMTRNSRGLKKPLAYWFDNGSYKSGTRQTRKGYNRGELKALHFMAAAEGKAADATNEIVRNYEKQVVKLFKKSIK